MNEHSTGIVAADDVNQTLRESRDRWRALFDFSPMETIVVDVEGCITDINTAKRVSGTRLPLVGDRMYVDYAGNHETDMRAELMNCIKTGSRKEFSEQQYEDRFLCIRIAPFPDKKPEGAVITSQDITDRVALESRVRQSHKMESIGILASGVAHEINNPINGIMNYAQLILDSIGPDDPLNEYANSIEKETKRVANIIRNLLSLSRSAKENKKPFRISDIIADSVSLSKSSIMRDQINLDVDVPEDLPEVECHAAQLQQVFINLLSNARDAVNEKYPESPDEKRLKITAHLIKGFACQWVRVTVEDNGSGVSEAARIHMFDPFYTSKRPDKGTGLGLYISYTIIDEHGGDMKCESEPGKYTRIHVDLPVSAEGR